MNNMERFTNVPKVEIPRAQFDRSHSHKTTFDGDYLIPIMCQEIYPGDTVQCDLNYMVRLATPLYPIMDDIYLDTFFFFVPTRLVWDNWRRFMGERHPDPDTTIDLTIPVITLDTDWSAGHGYLPDYLGIPLTDYSANGYAINALPVRAYQRIYNEWFRDQNLCDSNDYGLETGAGPDNDNYHLTDFSLNLSLQKRGKRHDYFTSCLPDLQKGDAVELPLGTDSPIYTAASTSSAVNVYSTADSAYRDLYTDGAANDVVKLDTTVSGAPGDTLYANLSEATAATVNEVRQAFQIQRLLEKDYRGGTRYPELIKSHFGADFYDISYRPEYLGGSSIPINITPVPNTDITVGGANEGADLSGVGTGVGGSSMVKSFVEHGFLFCIVNGRATLSYQEGLEKMWTRSTRYDFYFPTLANIGEQAVLNREICLDDTMIGASDDDDVFGYQERYAELKYQPNRITGQMRSNAATSLDVWHMSEELGDGAGSFPTLDSTFIPANSPWARVQATSADPDFIGDFYFNLKHTRCMPVYSIPGMIDHF